jgi:Fe-S protein assembly co-chaperone HscB
MANGTDTSLCLNCGKPAAGQLTCAGCGIVHPVDHAPDYFALFGLPRGLTVDADDLERRYYALSRESHPDLFHDRAPAEQAASLRTTALLTRAYRVLKDPVQRGLYWLTLHGESLGRDNERVPPALAALVFEVQEKLEELRAARRSGGGSAEESGLRDIRGDLRAQLNGFIELLAQTYGRNGGDDAATLAEIKRLLSELHYVRTLARDVDKELEPEWNAS